MLLILLGYCLFGINAKSALTEELAPKNGVCGTTAGDNTLKAVKKTLIQYKLKWNLLRCITTNGKNMNEAERDTGEQIYEASKK